MDVAPALANEDENVLLQLLQQDFIAFGGLMVLTVGFWAIHVAAREGPEAERVMCRELL